MPPHLISPLETLPPTPINPLIRIPMCRPLRNPHRIIQIIAPQIRRQQLRIPTLIMAALDQEWRRLRVVLRLERRAADDESADRAVGHVLLDLEGDACALQVGSVEDAVVHTKGHVVRCVAGFRFDVARGVLLVHVGAAVAGGLAFGVEELPGEAGAVVFDVL